MTYVLRALVLMMALLLGQGVGAQHHESPDPLSETPLNVLSQNAEKGDAASQNQLGMRYTYGRGTAKNYAKALMWFRKAAAQDYIAAWVNIGLMYHEGWGVRQDYTQALSWQKKAAERGDDTGLHNLARHYRDGLGVPADLKKAADLYRRAAEAGNSFSQAALGDLYRDGRGLRQDYDQAVLWYRKSAAQLQEVGLYRLAYMYDAGLGVSKDNTKALEYYRAAAARGNAAARDRAKELSAETILTSSAAPSADTPRIALIIANSEYGPNIGRLTNPVNDAALVATTLGALGFQVEVLKNADQRSMKRAIARFGSKLRQAGRGSTGLFFYAGHGVQSRGTNYLIPIGAAIEAEADVDLEAVPADTVLSQMEEAGSSTNIIILDACRNMPLSRSFRSGARGLARMDAPNGSFIAYSTAPGAVAADGEGKNSPFAVALAQHLPRKGQPIEVAFRNVRRAVLEMTAEKQTPWDSSSLISPFYFVDE